MRLRAEDIENRSFHVQVRGYEQSQVKDLLTQVADHYRAVGEGRPPTITLARLESVSFSTGLRGFDPNEVDAFLREIASDLTDGAASREPRDDGAGPAAVAGDGAARHPSPFKEVGDEIARLLEEAAAAADRIRRAAEEEAASICRQAERYAEETRSTVDAELAARRATVEREAEARLAVANERLVELDQAERAAAERIDQTLSDLERLRRSLGATAEPGGRSAASRADAQDGGVAG